MTRIRRSIRALSLLGAIGFAAILPSVLSSNSAAGASPLPSVSPQTVPLSCPYGDSRTATDESVKPGVVVATPHTYGPTTYTAYTIDTGGHLTIIGPITTIATTDHLVAAWQDSTDCSGFAISRNAWIADAQGGVFGETTYSGPPANNFGSMAGKPLNQPVVGMSPTSDGQGYWLVASDGGIFAFGDAQFHGSMGGHPLNQPVTGMAVTPTGGGYWMVASDGGIFAFGNAQFYGSMGGHPLNQPIEAMIPTPTGHGYWMVASDGGIFAFGDASFHGSTGGQALSAPIAGMIPNGAGYTLIGQNGQLYPFS
ncbi:MAG: hypothetical protein ACRDYZ_03275 [Acidimicrobiales bacterium]